MTFEGQSLAEGLAAGPVAAIAPLSFWGGYDSTTGLIIDRHHPACGRSLAGTVLVMASGRGSSSSSSVLAEAIRAGTAPAAIVLAEPDPILVVGALVAEALYGRTCPIVVLSPEDHASLAGIATAEVAAGANHARVLVP